jgi:hypothetical protein
MQETKTTDVLADAILRPLPALRTAGLFRPLKVGALALRIVSSCRR